MNGPKEELSVMFQAGENIANEASYLFFDMLLILLKILVTLASTSQTRQPYIVTGASSVVAMVTLQSSCIMHITL
jgi:hypothetical protein